MAATVAAGPAGGRSAGPWISGTSILNQRLPAGQTPLPGSRIPPRAAAKRNQGSTDTGRALDLIPRLNLTPEFSGGAGRNRTDDLYNAIVALSQLSYGPLEIGAPTSRRASARKLGSRPCERK